MLSAICTITASTVRGSSSSWWGAPPGSLGVILAVARAVAQAAERLQQLRVQPWAAGVDRRLLARQLDVCLDLLARLLHHLFDAAGGAASVIDETRQRPPRH